MTDVQVVGHMVLVRGDRVGPGAGAGDHGGAALGLVCVVGDDGLGGVQLAALEGMEPHGGGKHTVPEHHIPHPERGEQVLVTVDHRKHSFRKLDILIIRSAGKEINV